MTARRSRRSVGFDALAPAVCLLLAYLPALATAPGVIAADTKQYLVLDPGRLLATAASMWDPSQFGGHVTHQLVGYLWPTGPWFWLGDAIGLPGWVTQRLWIGTLFACAGLGMRWLARHLGLGAPAALVAGLAYQLSPYALTYVNRTSALLLPWAGLPALLVCTLLAVRRQGWRWPAVAALIAGTVGGLNATAAVLVALGPLLLLWWVWRARVARGGLVAAAAARLAVCSLGTSIWWVVALAVEARDGSDVLAYSETLRAVSTTSSAAEGLRGLGYWLFYGGGVDGPWNSAAPAYLANPALQTLGYTLAAAGLAGLVASRWAPRRWLATQAFAGLAIAALAFPPGAASPLGRLMAGAPERSTIVLALRSSTRALPLVVLALAAGLGAAFELVTARATQRVRWAGVVGATAVLAANFPALWTGDLVDADLRRPAELPAWWRDTATTLDGGDPSARVLELPGQEFAAYRWGTTTDPLLPGLTTRPVLARDLLPLGAPDTMDLLWALDDRAQQGRLEAASIAPVARLLGATDVVARLDAADERYRTPRAADVLDALQLAGLGGVRMFGPVESRPTEPARVDGRALVDAARSTPAVAIAPVDGPPAVRTQPVGDTIVLAGSGDGIVDAAAAGLLDGGQPVRYAADLAPDEPVPAGTPIVVTDSNRRRARHWRGTQDTVGFTEDAGPQRYAPDDADARLPLFPDARPTDETLAEQRGGRVLASAYGEPNAYRPEDRAAFAADGDTTTAWRVADRADPIGARWRIELEAARAVDTVRVVQPQRAANRHITEVVVRTENGRQRAALDDSSLTATGQVVRLGDPRTSWVEVEITATSTGKTPSLFGLDAVGFAEIDVGAHVDEVVRVPSAIVGRLAATAGGHPFAVVLTRERVDPAERPRSDPEPSLSRAFRVPSLDAPALTVQARLHQRADDAVLDELLAPSGDTTMRTSSRLAGAAAQSGFAALDGSAATMWTSAVDDTVGAWWELSLATPRALGRVEVTTARDERHSAARALDVAVDGGAPQRVQVGADGRATVDLGGVTGSRVRVTVVDAAITTGIDRRYGEAIALPVGFSEVMLDGVAPPQRPAVVNTGCRDDLLTLDGAPVPLEVRAATDDLLAGRPAVVRLCGPLPILEAGDHEVRSAPGWRTGLDVDRVVITDEWPTAAASPAGEVRVTERSRTSATLVVPPSSEPRWLVWPEGANRGWRATVEGRDLGRSTRLAGGGNVWRLEPSDAAVTVRLAWTPQRWVTAGLLASLAAALACVVAVTWPRRRAVAPAPVLATTALPSVAGARAPSTIPALVLAVITALVVHPVYGAGVVVVWWAWRRWSGSAVAVAVAASGPAVALAVGAYVVVRQLVSQPVAGFGWPLALSAAHRPALFAVALVALHALGERDERVAGRDREQRDDRQVEARVAEEGPHRDDEPDRNRHHDEPPAPRPDRPT